ncbi:hypothetical protein BST61_g531 [Cercospora zeina]
MSLVRAQVMAMKSRICHAMTSKRCLIHDSCHNTNDLPDNIGASCSVAFLCQLRSRGYVVEVVQDRERVIR